MTAASSRPDRATPFAHASAPLILVMAWTIGAVPVLVFRLIVWKARLILEDPGAQLFASAWEAWGSLILAVLISSCLVLVTGLTMPSLMYEFVAMFDPYAGIAEEWQARGWANRARLALSIALYTIIVAIACALNAFAAAAALAILTADAIGANRISAARIRLWESATVPERALLADAAQAAGVGGIVCVRHIRFIRPGDGLGLMSALESLAEKGYLSNAGWERFQFAVDGMPAYILAQTGRAPIGPDEINRARWA